MPNQGKCEYFATVGQADLHTSKTFTLSPFHTFTLQGECEYFATAGPADGEGDEPDERERQADVEGDGGQDEDLLVGHRDRKVISTERISAASY